MMALSESQIPPDAQHYLVCDYGLTFANPTADTKNNSENTTNDTPPEVNGFDYSSVEGKNSVENHEIQSTTKPANDFAINGTATSNHNKIANTPSTSITTSQNKT
uniref:Uncharacterized protein n=1 Tax=Magallana gigas TaxID=29159 RepID=A0A8W8LNQ8_MAGGI